MSQEQLKNLILNEPSKEEIEKLIKIEEQSGQYVKYGLYNEDKNSNEYNTIVVDFGAYPHVIYAVQNGKIILQLELKEKKITIIDEIPCIEDQFHVLSVWRGDITTLQVDAIVNAGNTSLLGCFIPNHSCIDNAIHTYAGIRLRLSCNEMMNGKEEKVGQAKITDAYNLPSQYVIHTVGPMIGGHVTKEDKDKLRSCYYSCLELAQKKQIRTIAFPSISTGVFHFPKALAAEIAVATVCEFLKDNPGTLDRVIFNVFTEEDQEIYERIFRNKKINL